MRRQFLLLCCLIPVLSAQEHFVDASFQGTSTGRSAAPWKRIQDAFSMGKLAQGDIVSVRPGTYRVSEFWITIPGITLRRDGNTAGRVILDGGVAQAELANRDAAGRQQTIDNGTRFTKVLAVRADAPGVTLDGLEVCNGYSGIFTEADNTRILNCHVHHTSQNGISSTGDGTEIGFCTVHDVVLYNLDGQCLAKATKADGSPDIDLRKKVVDAAGVVTTKNMDWGQGITVKGDYPKNNTSNFTKIANSANIHDNLLWNAWSEGFGTYCSTGSSLTGNTAFNIWRVGYYAQNADGATLSGNLAFVAQDGFDRYATKGCYAFANELNRFHYQAANPINTFLLPDTSNFMFRDNSSVGGGYSLASVFGHPLDIQDQGFVTISGNLLTLPPTAMPCIELDDTVRGKVQVTSNVLVKSNGRTSVESDFIRHRANPGDTPAQQWSSSGNSLHLRPVAFSTIDAAMAQVVAEAKAFANSLPTATATAAGITTLRQRVSDLRTKLSVLKSSLQSGTPVNTAPRITGTSASSTTVTLP